jgi:phage nucleotide-binding protein
MKIVNAKELKPVALNVLIYGDSGVGKTSLMATAPAPVLLLDMEGGTLPLAGKDVDIVHVTSPKDIEEAYKVLKENGKYKTVVLDSITEMLRIVLEHVVKSNPTVSRAYGDQPSLSDYGRLNELMRRNLRAFRDLPIHTFFTALAQDMKDETDGTITRMPNLSGKLPYEVAGYMDIVGYMVAQEDKENGEIKRAVLVQPRGKIMAKDRTGKLGSAVTADVSKWLSAINGKGVKK